MCGNSSQKINMRDSHAGFDIRMNKRSLYGGPGRWMGRVTRSLSARQRTADAAPRIETRRPPVMRSSKRGWPRATGRDGRGNRSGMLAAVAAAVPSRRVLQARAHSTLHGVVFAIFVLALRWGPLMARRRRACARDARFFARRIDAHAALLPYAPVMKKRCFA